MCQFCTPAGVNPVPVFSLLMRQHRLVQAQQSSANHAAAEKLQGEQMLSLNKVQPLS